jgi:predicted amidohydrolase
VAGVTEPRWDLIIRGGTLMDPAQAIAAKRDVAFSGGRVAAVAEALAGEGTEVIDATGALVAPGLIDIHAHVYHGLYIGRHADQTSLVNGVTTVVDAGSAGWMTLAGLRDYVIPTYRTRVYAFLHIGATGLTVNRIMPELADINFAQVEEAARTAAENRPLVVGIKVSIAHRATGQGNEANAREALRRAHRRPTWPASVSWCTSPTRRSRSPRSSTSSRTVTSPPISSTGTPSRCSGPTGAFGPRCGRRRSVAWCSMSATPRSTAT